MGRIIVTETTISQIPYRMNATGHPLYSYEELCYYIQTRLPLWLLETDREGLTEWVRQRGVALSDTDGLSPEEAAIRIIQAGSYFQKEEAARLAEEIESYRDRPGKYKEKEKGDWYLKYGKLLGAYFSYERAKSQVDGGEQKSFLASLSHNMGLVLCRFFYWEEAEEHFLEALGLEEREETKNALSFVRERKKMEWKAGGGTAPAEKLGQKRKEFLEELGQ